MTGFNSKRQASLDHIGYQGRETRPDELAQPNPWKDAIDNALIWWHIGTIESFPTAKAALDALIDWHVAVALDPEVSSAAQALVDRGATQPQAGPVAWQWLNSAVYRKKLPKFAEAGAWNPLYAAPQARPAVAEPLSDERIDEIFEGAHENMPKGVLFRTFIARAIEQAHGIKGSAA